MVPPIGERFSCPGKKGDRGCRPSDVAEMSLAPEHPTADWDSSTKNHQYERKSCGGGLSPQQLQRFRNDRDDRDCEQRQVTQFCKIRCCDRQTGDCAQQEAR